VLFEMWGWRVPSGRPAFVEWLIVAVYTVCIPVYDAIYATSENTEYLAQGIREEYQFVAGFRVRTGVH
jgi:hypothetical protein